MSLLLTTILQLLQRRPVMAQLLGAGVPHARVEELAEKYRRGIAQAIGISPEDINEEVVRRWVIHWLRAIVKPESWAKYGLI